MPVQNVGSFLIAERSISHVHWMLVEAAIIQRSSAALIKRKVVGLKGVSMMGGTCFVQLQVTTSFIENCINFMGECVFYTKLVNPLFTSFI